MKKTLYTLWAALLTFAATAQSESQGLQVGLNAARLLQLMSNNTVSADINPYMLDVGYATTKVGFRLGLGMDNNSSINQPSAGNGQIMTQRDSSNLDWRLGAYYRVALHQKWQMNIGLDFYSKARETLLATRFTNENGEEVETDNTTTYKESGVCPSITVQYRPHPKVSIGTELLLRFGKHTLTQKSTSTLFPEFDTEVITDGNRNYFVAPSALFICLTL